MPVQKGGWAERSRTIFSGGYCLNQNTLPTEPSLRPENGKMGTLLLLSLLGCLSIPTLTAETSYMLFCKPLARKPLELPAHQQSARILGWGNIPISLCLFVYLHCITNADCGFP